jgi:hypothetical protein
MIRAASDLSGAEMFQGASDGSQFVPKYLLDVGPQGGPLNSVLSHVNARPSGPTRLRSVGTPSVSVF